MSKPDVIDAVITGLSVLAVILQVFVAAMVLLGLVALVFAPARRLLAAVRDTLLGGELWVAFLIALGATAGSLFFSEYANFIPCRLCWIQRIFMYPLVIILLVGALRRDTRAAVQYAFLLPIVGAGFSLYHLYIEANPERESQGCKAGGGSCATKWFEEFGYITLPMLALSAFAAIGVLLAMVWSRRHPAAAAVAGGASAEPSV